MSHLLLGMHLSLLSTALRSTHVSLARQSLLLSHVQDLHAVWCHSYILTNVLSVDEGGPSTAGGKGAGLMEVAKANADPRMADAVFNIVQTWQQWFGGDTEHPNFNYFTLGAQPLEQPWGSFTNLW